MSRRYKDASSCFLLVASFMIRPSAADVDSLQKPWRSLNSNRSVNVRLDDWVWSGGMFLQFIWIISQHEYVVINAVVMESSEEIHVSIIFVDYVLSALANQVEICKERNWQTHVMPKYHRSWRASFENFDFQVMGILYSMHSQSLTWQQHSVR